MKSGMGGSEKKGLEYLREVIVEIPGDIDEVFMIQWIFFIQEIFFCTAERHGLGDEGVCGLRKYSRFSKGKWR